MKITALIPSAGSGLRMGGDTRKQYIHIHEKPITAHTLQRFQGLSEISQIILIVPVEDIPFCEREIVSRYNISKAVKVIAGGRERQDSVYNGIRALDGDEDIVIVHDGVRPFATAEMIRESIRAASESGAAIVAIPAKDTIKSISSDGLVEKTVDRAKLWQVQTPQTFRRELLEEAYKKAMSEKFYGTDDSSLVERIDGRVMVVQGSEFNIKITTPRDLILAEGIIRHFDKLSSVQHRTSNKENKITNYK
ncbi:MAG: 2-C-methyl-D-erythritol 4-phosphate cytidylyltransferase [Nitrospinae bacterium]|nr:2-C-methyl-D-erythritol 4-phosphate cytidylyltransferase [Nitrospinota bacterium]